MKFCENCGHHLGDGTKICSKCLNKKLNSPRNKPLKCTRCGADLYVGFVSIKGYCQDCYDNEHSGDYLCRSTTTKDTNTQEKGEARLYEW